MTHTPASCDLLHDPHADVSEAQVPSADLLEVIDLLELNPHGHRLVRLSRTDWRHVYAVRDRLAAARTCVSIPTPRTPPDQPAGAL